MKFNNTRIIISELFLVSILLSACGGGGDTVPAGGGSTVPAAPASVAAACGNSKIAVSWTAVTGASSYSVFRSTATGVAGTQVGTVASGTSYADAFAGTVGNAYYYTVKAVNSAGTSTASAEAAETFCKIMGGATQGKQFTPTISTANVSTLAGSSGHSGLPVNGGVGANARFSLPQGMTTDGTYLYVADYLNNGIQRIDPATQSATLFAGDPAGSSGNVDAIGTSARFFRPYDITSDGTNLYVTDYNNCTIRKIVIATAAVTTFAGSAGTCTSTTTSFAYPQGITADGTSLFVTENTVVRRIDIASHAISTFAGIGSVGHNDAVGVSASFNNLEGITTDGISLFVVDRYYQDIRKIDIATATVSSLAGNYTNVTTTTSTDGTGIAATFNLPMGITTDGTNLYVVESSSGVTGGGDVVRKIANGTTVATTSAVVTTLAGSPGLSGTADGIGAAARFSGSWGITVKCGRLYIGDTGNSSIRLIQ